MAFSRPTLSELVDQAQQDLLSRLQLAGAVLRRSVVYVLARVVAGAAHMLHGHIEFQSRQCFADTAEAEYLDRIGSLYGVTRTAPAFSTGNVTLTGTNATVAPAGTVLTRADGTAYTTDADATIASGTATVAVTASVAAADGDAPVATVLTFESPIAGITATSAVASGGLSGGADLEADEDYRVRVVERIQAPPHGGAEADYLAWAKEVSGVTRAWVYPNELGAGTVVIRFVRDNDASVIPDAGEVSTVQDYVDERRPVTAAVTVIAPISVTLNPTIHLVPNTTATRAAVTAELTDMLSRESVPGQTLVLSQIRTAIGNAAGVTDYTLSSPVADVTYTTGQIPTLGWITWT